MSTDNDKYRTSLLEAVRQIQVEQEANEMTDEQLMEVIWSGLGLPRGTPLSNEQIDMIAKYQAPS